MRARRAERTTILTLAAIVLLQACGGAPPASAQQTAAGPAPAAEPSGLGEAIDRDVARIREATAPFHDLDEAVKAGYPRNVAGCMDNPPQGAMGYHHQNAELLDASLELERPEILVYERMADGDYELTGVEYVVPFSTHPPEAEPPTIMGQALKPAPGLRIWYLHVWVWRPNPSGLFADWNPDVACPGP
jgi:hypothetical protein